MTALEKKIKSNIIKAAEGDLSLITPGLCVQVVKSGQLKVDLRLGQTYKYYDLASLTKVVFTVTAVMQAHENKIINLQAPVKNYLPWWPHQNVAVRQLLTHTGGLPWWAPFYKVLRKDKGIEKMRKHLQTLLSRTVRVGAGLNSPGGRQIKAVYSDIDFIMLGFLLEAVNECSLIDLWQNFSLREIAPGLHFNLNNRPQYARAHYAPTEKCPWRKKILRGEVHDDNTWSMGGISSHAGLFGTIDDVTSYGQILRRAYRNEGREQNRSQISSQNQNQSGNKSRRKSKVESILASHATVQKFTRRAITRSQGDWALGFIMPTKGAASCGKYFHSTSFGHTGFTGTSIWYDPKQDLLVTILSNRVHPTRKNARYVQFRPKIHDIICEAINEI